MDLYSENILHHFKNPSHKGQLDNADTQALEHNPSCGDKIEVQLKLDSNNKVTEAMFDGIGCAISQAAASMLTEKLIGKTLEEVSKIPNDEVYKMLGIEISPGRVKCALLSLVAAKSAAHNHKKDA